MTRYKSVMFHYRIPTCSKGTLNLLLWRLCAYFFPVNTLKHNGGESISYGLPSIQQPLTSTKRNLTFHRLMTYITCTWYTWEWIQSPTCWVTGRLFLADDWFARIPVDYLGLQWNSKHCQLISCTINWFLELLNCFLDNQCWSQDET